MPPLFLLPLFSPGAPFGLTRLLYFVGLLYPIYFHNLMTLPSRLRWLWLTLVVVLLDRASKAWFDSQTTEGWRKELVHNFIYLVHSKNPGIAFGVLADSSSPFTRILLIAGSLVVIVALAWLLVSGRAGGTFATAGLAFLLGGAAGNVTDRIFHGAVTDFFEVWLGTYRWPAFNVADSAITIGAILILLDILFPSRVSPSQSVES